jgi:hypothetical protein
VVDRLLPTSSSSVTSSYFTAPYHRFSFRLSSFLRLTHRLAAAHASRVTVAFSTFGYASSASKDVSANTTDLGHLGVGLATLYLDDRADNHPLYGSVSRQQIAFKPPFLLDPKNHPFQVSSYHYSFSIRHSTVCNKSYQLTALYGKVLHISTLAFLGIDRRRG